MSNFKIFETDTYYESLSKVFNNQQIKIINQKLYPQLRNQPYFGPNIKKLRDYSPETWRYRIGQHRFFYTINEREKIVYMLDVIHRKDAY